MELILWRHAEAVDGLPDMERALTAKGHKQAEKMAAWLKAHLPERTHVLVSPARRTQQTAAALDMNFSTLDVLAPGADPEEVLRAAGWPDESESVLIVGHQPTLGEAAALALGQDESTWSIRKGAVWWISLRGSEPVLRAVISPDMV